MHDMTVKVKAWALPILEHNEQKYDYTHTHTHTATCVIEYCAYAMLAASPPALSVFAVHARNKAGAAASQANCCFKLINFVFISGKDNNNNTQQ